MAARDLARRSYTLGKFPRKLRTPLVSPFATPEILTKPAPGWLDVDKGADTSRANGSRQHAPWATALLPIPMSHVRCRVPEPSRAPPCRSPARYRRATPAAFPEPSWTTSCHSLVHPPFAGSCVPGAIQGSWLVPWRTPAGVALPARASHRGGPQFPGADTSGTPHWSSVHVKAGREGNRRTIAIGADRTLDPNWPNGRPAGRTICSSRT